jgi:hypothetical protein
MITPTTSVTAPSLLDHCTHLSFDPMTSLDEILYHISSSSSSSSSFVPTQHLSEQQQGRRGEEQAQEKEQEQQEQQQVALPPLLLVDVTDNQNVSDHFIFEILNPSNQKVRFIGFILRNCHRLTHFGLVQLLSHHPAPATPSSFPNSSSSSPFFSPLEYFQLLDLSGCSAVVTDDLLRLLGENSSFHLKILSFRNCFRLTDVGLHWLASPAAASGGSGTGSVRGESCDSLTSLDLSGCGQITDRGVTSLAFHLPHLDELHLQGCTRVTSESIVALAHNCRDLKILNLQGCVRVDDVALDHLTRHCLWLEVLNLQGCHRLTDASLFAIVCNCPNLTSLDIRHCSGLSRTAVTAVLSLPHHRFHSLYDGGENGSPAHSGPPTEVTDPSFDHRRYE